MIVIILKYFIIFAFTNLNTESNMIIKKVTADFHTEGVDVLKFATPRMGEVKVVNTENVSDKFTSLKGFCLFNCKCENEEEYLLSFDCDKMMWSLYEE